MLILNGERLGEGDEGRDDVAQVIGDLQTAARRRQLGGTADLS